MFFGRSEELETLKKALSDSKKTAVLVYGKRRIGKTTLIAEAAKSFDGIVVNFLCVQSSYHGNLVLLARAISHALHLPEIQFGSIFDTIEFLGRQEKKYLLILDEYQYMKESLKRGEMDSYMQLVIDKLPANIKLILCGSYISVMKELLLESNPLFGRFSHIMHIEEFDYFGAADFYPERSVEDKTSLYAVFGGSPYVLSCLDPKQSIEDNIIQLLLPATGILRSYIENVILREIQKSYDIRIFEILGNGKKRYRDIQSALGKQDNGLLDKQLKNLIDMEAIDKIYPINKAKDKKKQFYEIKDNLMRFYFTFIFGNESIIDKFGSKAFFENEISHRLKTFLSLRFEGIVCQYFKRLAHTGRLKGAYDFGSYWYDDKDTQTNGQFDCVIKKKNGYDFYECKFFNRPMTLTECETEEMQVRNIAGLEINKIGFVCLSGFDFKQNQYELIDGEALYTPIEEKDFHKAPHS